MISQEEPLKPFGIFTESFGNVTDMVTEMIFVGKYIRKKNIYIMYKINWYIKSYVQDTAQRIWVTNWLAMYSNVNDKKKLRIWIKRVVMGFHDKHSSQNHYIWFFLIVHMQLNKLWKHKWLIFVGP